MYNGSVVSSAWALIVCSEHDVGSSPGTLLYAASTISAFDLAE
jgi:hypothetical protein